MIGLARYHVGRWIKILTRGRKRVTPGDLIAVPTEGTRTVLAKVLFLSEHFRGIAVFRVWPVDAGKGPPPATGPSYVFFTVWEPIALGDWRTVGSQTPTTDELRLLEYYCAGDVWFGDKYLRPASQAERARLPNLVVLGITRVKMVAGQISRGAAPNGIFRVPER